MASTYPDPHSKGPSDEQLWSWVDRDAPELDQYLQADPAAQARVDEIRQAIGSFEAADPAVLHPTEIGEYSIDGVLGRGGMGVVYDAQQASPKRKVALKVMPAEYALDKRWLRRFQREADALARLSHVGIASIFGVGSGADGRPYIAMEQITGAPLGTYVEQTNPSREQRLRLAKELCDAVGHAHQAGVVHRDIKPANILVKPGGQPVVVDFGLARLVDEEFSQASLMSQTGTLLGTLPYMSPEQIAGRSELGPASDVYSLGVVLYELLVGHMPYEVKDLSLLDAARRIQEAPPKRSRRVRRKLRGDLGVVLFKALEKDPARRYGNAHLLAEELRRCLEGRPVEAAPVGLAWRGFQFLRRHWDAAGFIVLGGALTALLMLGTRLPPSLRGNPWSRTTPFEALRWLGDSPQVQVQSTWYGLVAINDLRSGYIIGFCQQAEGRTWRKRFSEDLVDVLTRMGSPANGSVNLTLRELETGRSVEIANVPLSGRQRQEIWLNRNRWPWSFDGPEAEGMVNYLGKRWALRSVDGVPLDQFSPRLSYDSYCDRLSYSPGHRLSFVLQDLESGELTEFKDVLRLLERHHGG